MKKIIITCSLLLSLLILSGWTNEVKPLTTSSPILLLDSVNCTSLLGSPGDSNYPAYWIQFALNVMRYVGIAALVVLSTIDFIQAIVKQDNDALNKAIKTTAKRFVFAVILFFVPLFVETIMNLFGIYGNCPIN